MSSEFDWQEAFRVFQKAMVAFQEKIQPIIKELDASIKKNAPLLERIRLNFIFLELAKKNQLVIVWNTTDAERDYIISSENPQAALFNVFKKNDYTLLNSIISSTKESGSIPSHAMSIYDEAVKAYFAHLYNPCIMALFPIIDNLLTKITQNHNTSFDARLKSIEQSMQAFSFTAFTYTVLGVMFSFSRQSDFKNGTEPNELNRHWLLHGRSTRKVSSEDCIKVFCFILALTILDQAQNID